MSIFISVLIILVCVLLVLVILVQNSKGGGLASNFAASNQVMGVRKTTDILEKTTWILAGALLLLSLFSTPKITQDQVVPTSQTKEKAAELPTGPGFNTQEAQKNVPAPAQPGQEKK